MKKGFKKRCDTAHNSCRQLDINKPLKSERYQAISCRAKKALALLTSVLLIGLTACNGPSGESKSEEKELKKITFCLDWTPNTNHTGFYVAKALGYYEDAGLDVEIVQPPEDGATAMCASGQAQFAINAQDTIASAFDSETPLEVTAVSALIQHNTSGIISKKGNGITSPKGLENKNYSTWESPIELAMLKNIVEADGGDFEKVKLIPNNITDEPAALEANQTDAIWIFYGWGGITAKVRNFEFDYLDFKELNSKFDYYTPILIANNSFLSENPDTAKAFISATKKGYEYAVENPREAGDILIKGDDTGSLEGSEELVYASQEWLSDKYIDDAEKWGYIDPQRWNGFYSWLYENKLTTLDLSGKGFSNDYLP